MKTTRSWWLLGIPLLSLAVASVAWGAHARATSPPGARSRIQSARVQQHHALGAMLAFAPEPPPADAPPPPPPPAVRVAPRRHAEPAVAILVEDEPPPPAPLLWDELFPGGGPGSKSKGKVSAGCFDQIQGVGGLSPCPESTPR